MPSQAIHELCERGSEQLIATQYLEAEATLVQAEALAWDARDWDALARLYMPLQEARRQRRQRCGEGMVALDLIADGPDDVIDAKRVLENFPHGQLLVAGWGSLEPAAQVRKLAAERGLYVETFLGAAVHVSGRTAVVIAPLEQLKPVAREFQSIEQLEEHLPAHCLILDDEHIIRGKRKGTPKTFGEVMAMWERLHAPFLAAADSEPDALRKIELYRETIGVDYACELAHQKLSDLAHGMAREAKST
jgi:hypothetical protein